MSAQYYSYLSAYKGTITFSIYFIMRTHLILFVVGALLLGGCAQYTRLLASEKSMLSRVARNNTLKPDQKLDSLLASSIRVMEAALQPINPAKGGKMVAAYYNQNEAAMELIARDVNTNFQQMNLLDQGTFAINMVRSSRARQFADLYPKFRKKYAQVSGAARFLGFFGRSLGKLGRLADLLK